MDTPLVSIPPSFGGSAGPLLLAYFLIWFLYGILCVQLYLYYQAFPFDPKLLKAIVYLMYTLETIQIVLITYDGWDVFATHYGNLANFDDIHHIWFTGPVLSGIVSVLAQLFYANRIMTFSNGIGGRIVAGVVATIAIMQCCAAVVGGAQARHIGKLSEVPSKTYVATSVWLAGAATCDILISGSMSWFLAQSGTIFKETKDVIGRLIRLTIETGVITALFAVLDLSLFLAYPQHTYHVVPAFCLGKMYSNALLVVLNNRAHIANRRSQDRSSTGFTTGTINFSLDAVQVESIILTQTSAGSRSSVTAHDARLHPVGRENVGNPSIGSFTSQDAASSKSDAYGKPLREEV
ncbi:hypothetical protein VNI00_005253 [Paramarasmius palmivorus]|uniref:DUF6534 domain-containing protein n=1 Tax=Paramarasmius palmivorus TaxID=297713 RepID=A0AAW0DGG3_9AGAR